MTDAEKRAVRAAAIRSERKRCAEICEGLALAMEHGAGESEPGGRLRQAEEMIRTGAKSALIKAFRRKAALPTSLR